MQCSRQRCICWPQTLQSITERSPCIPHYPSWSIQAASETLDKTFVILRDNIGPLALLTFTTPPTGPAGRLSKPCFPIPRCRPPALRLRPSEQLHPPAAVAGQRQLLQRVLAVLEQRAELGRGQVEPGYAPDAVGREHADVRGFRHQGGRERGVGVGSGHGGCAGACSGEGGVLLLGGTVRLPRLSATC